MAADDIIAVTFATNADTAARSIRGAANATQQAERVTTRQAAATKKSAVAADGKTVALKRQAAATAAAAAAERQLQAAEAAWTPGRGRSAGGGAAAASKRGAMITAGASVGGFSRLSPIGGAVSAADSAGGMGGMIAGVAAAGLILGTTMKVMDQAITHSTASLQRLAESAARVEKIQREGERRLQGTAAGIAGSDDAAIRRLNFAAGGTGLAAAREMTHMIGGITGRADARGAVTAAADKGILSTSALEIAARVAETGVMTATQAVGKMTPGRMARMAEMAKAGGHDPVAFSAAALVGQEIGRRPERVMAQMDEASRYQPRGMAERDRARRDFEIQAMDISLTDAGTAGLRQQLVDTFAPVSRALAELYGQESEQLRIKQQILDQESRLVGLWMTATGRGTTGTRADEATRTFSETVSGGM